jgi:hypothetical protein
MTKRGKPPQRLARLACVNVFVDGWRDVVVLSHGRKWLFGFEAATLHRVRVPVEYACYTLRNYSRSRLARRLRRNAKCYPASKTVRAAIVELGRRP